jgi:ParB-like chromosome segregation protein Spo0J
MSKPSKSYRLRITGYQVIPANKIKKSPHNWRLHLKEQRAALQASMERIGMVDACVVRKLKGDNYELVDGHLRTELIGTSQEVPCLITDLTEDEARMQITVHDPIAAMAAQDDEILAANLKWMDKQKETLARLVFPEFVVDPLVNNKAKPKIDFPEFDENLKDEVEYHECPKCGHKFPK